MITQNPSQSVGVSCFVFTLMFGSRCRGFKLVIFIYICDHM